MENSVPLKKCFLLVDYTETHNKKAEEDTEFVH